ncbi:unnamed protein product, partial [Vitis vinifera]
MVAESWFRGLWKTSKKHEDGSEKALIGVLAFEVASMMSKLVHLWQSLSDKQVTRLREEIMNSVGIRKLVSEDDEFIVGLICAEITENLRHVLRSVVRLSEKCNETSLKSFGLVFDDFVKTGADPYGWEFSWKKMERKVKKMERFILVNANLNSTTKSGPILKMDKTSNFYSGPLKSSTTKSGPISGMIKTVNFYSGPLGKAKTKSGRISGISKMSKKLWWTPQKSSDRNGKKLPLKPNRLTQVGPFKGCMMVGNNSPQKLLNAPPETLGAAALSLHYANVIIIIEKLVASPHLIGHDARDDLYKWSEAMAGILEWLAPLAHNMIRWQSERSFEQQNLVSRTNVLLVQTLYFADQEKTEAIITELLVGLNYIWRFGRELNAKALLECASSKIFEEYLDLDA